MSPRGGAREGAGAKKKALDEKRVELRTTVAPSTMKKLESIQDKTGEPFGKIIDEKLEDV